MGPVVDIARPDVRCDVMLRPPSTICSRVCLCSYITCDQAVRGADASARLAEAVRPRAVLATGAGSKTIVDSAEPSMHVFRALKPPEAQTVLMHHPFDHPRPKPLNHERLPAKVSRPDERMPSGRSFARGLRGCGTFPSMCVSTSSPRGVQPVWKIHLGVTLGSFSDRSKSWAWVLRR